MGRVEGKIAIVTGGAMGLGQAQARLLASEGATVIVTDLVVDEGEATVSGLACPGLFLEQDVASESGWDRVRDEVLGRFGRLDILVNNAAIQIPGSIEETSFDQWRRVQAVNADGTFLGCRMAVRAMKETGGGSIVNIASVASHSGEAGGAAYSGSKGSVRALTKSIAVHCLKQGYGIRCNSVHPGVMDTPMVRKMRESMGLEGKSPHAGDPVQLA
jgi:3(or 17)beta-hydroxysteroid dehydrogenase